MSLTTDDSFNAAWKIINIPKEILNYRYKQVSFDVESLFTNVPLRKTVNIIIKSFYDDKLIQINLKKQSLKKSLLDACTKTLFMFNSKFYEWTHGFTMRTLVGQQNND